MPYYVSGSSPLICPFSLFCPPLNIPISRLPRLMPVLIFVQESKRRHQLPALGVRNQIVPQRIGPQVVAVTDNPQRVLRAGQRYVHPPVIPQKSDVVVLLLWTGTIAAVYTGRVGFHAGQDDDILLAPLEFVHC